MHEVTATVTATAPWLRSGSNFGARLMAMSVFVAVAAGTSFSVQAREWHGSERLEAPQMMLFGGPPEHVGRGVDRMLDGLNATPAQRAQIKEIAVAAASDLQAQRASGRGLREKGMQIFAAGTVDANAAESVRQQMSALQDQGSKRMLQAMLDVSKVLTAEQRTKFGERMNGRQAASRDRMQRWQTERSEHRPRPAEAK